MLHARPIRRPGRIDLQHPVSDHDLNKGLVSLWLSLPFPGYRGEKFVDLKGRNHGTLTNGPTWGGSLGRRGGTGRMTFVAGSSQYVEFPSLTDMSYTSGTISWWQRPHLAFDDGVIHGIGGPASGADLTFQKFSDNQLYFGWITQRVIIAATAANYTQNEWQQYHFTWVSGGTHYLYRNGIEIGTASGGTVAAAGAAWRIGHVPVVGAFFSGDIDDYKIRQRQLSASDVIVDHHDSLRGYPLTLNRLRRATVFDVGAAPTQIFSRKRIGIGLNSSGFRRSIYSRKVT